MLYLFFFHSCILLLLVFLSTYTFETRYQYSLMIPSSGGIFPLLSLVLHFKFHCHASRSLRSPTYHAVYAHSRHSLEVYDLRLTAVLCCIYDHGRSFFGTLASNLPSHSFAYDDPGSLAEYLRLWRLREEGKQVSSWEEFCVEQIRFELRTPLERWNSIESKPMAIAICTFFRPA
jgi:hypothetical protein